MVDLVATLTRWPTDLSAVPAGVSALEVRADLVGDLAPEALRFPGAVRYVLRSRAYGGRADDPPRRRHARLIAAARRYDRVDLEADRDLVPAVLAGVPARQRRICWHGRALPLDDLRARFRAMAAVPAAAYLLAPEAPTVEDALVPLHLLAELGRTDVTAYGTGPAGTWSRLLAPWFGTPVVTGPADGVAGGAGTVDGDGALSVQRLWADYGFPAVTAPRALCGMVGKAAPSFTRMLNRACRAHGGEAWYLPFLVPAVAGFRTGFWPAVPDGLDALGMPVRGLTVSAPLKEAALAVADEAAPAAWASGAANALVRRRDRWRAETTDSTAVVAVLRRAGVRVGGRAVAVVGCGGAGRAAAVALARRGADVTLVNRSEARGRLAGDLLGLRYAPLASFTPRGAAVVVHATPAAAEVPFPVHRLGRGAVVVDLVFTPGRTALVTAARRHGVLTIDGHAVLRAEARQQFRLLTSQREGVRHVSHSAP
ncbi:type I 3-dehydroquinate dehydratase [Actinomycetes bacterium KLBMP 9797]